MNHSKVFYASFIVFAVTEISLENGLSQRRLSTSNTATSYIKTQMMRVLKFFYQVEYLPINENESPATHGVHHMWIKA